MPGMFCFAVAHSEYGKVIIVLVVLDTLANSRSFFRSNITTVVVFC